MTDFNMPENIKTEALLINVMHYISKTSETSFEGLTEIIDRNAHGNTPSPAALHKILMHISHQLMTFTILCDEAMEEFMAASRAYNKDHQDKRDEIQEELKAHPFMQKMMVYVSESDEQRAHRLLVEAVGEGMPDDLANDIRAMLSND